MRFTKIPEDTFENLQLNAGILLRDFDVTDGSFDEEDMLGATSGGNNFTATSTYIDFAEDVDNAAKNMKEFKKRDDTEVKMSGTFIACNSATAKLLMGSAAISGEKLTPLRDVSDSDFTDIWWVGDYSDKNGENNGGYMAIHILNALSTGGFSVQTGDKAKGQFAYEFTGHYSISAQSVVPYEVYIHSGEAEPTGTTEPTGNV